MKLFTIGFTKKNAKMFFDLLRKNNIEQIIDIRVNNTSQLAGFTKKDDLEFFLKELCGINYHHFKCLARFLCTEPSADYCHRGLLAEYLKEHWKDVEVEHL